MMKANIVMILTTILTNLFSTVDCARGKKGRTKLWLNHHNNFNIRFRIYYYKSKKSIFVAVFDNDNNYFHLRLAVCMPKYAGFHMNLPTTHGYVGLPLQVTYLLTKPKSQWQFIINPTKGSIQILDQPPRPNPTTVRSRGIGTCRASAENPRRANY